MKELETQEIYEITDKAEILWAQEHRWTDEEILLSKKHEGKGRMDM